MKAMGRHIQYGAASMTTHGSSPDWIQLAWQWLFRPKLDPLEMISQNKAVIGFNLIWLWDRLHELTPVLDEMLQHCTRAPHVGLVKQFDEAEEALREFQQGMTVGKVVLQVPTTRPLNLTKKVSGIHTKKAHASDGFLKYFLFFLVCLAPLLASYLAAPDGRPWLVLPRWNVVGNKRFRV